MNGDAFIVFVLWVLFSAIGLAVVTLFSPFPVAAADEAMFIDEAFTFLTYLAVPIFSFVLTMLVYSGIRFRNGGTPSEDGPPTRSNRPIVVVWMIVTTILTIVVIIHPGITGLNEIRASERKPADILVEVEGQRFSWTITYPQFGVFSRNELVLPVDEHARFNLTVSENKPAVMPQSTHPKLQSGLEHELRNLGFESAVLTDRLAVALVDITDPEKPRYVGEIVDWIAFPRSRTCVSLADP